MVNSRKITVKVTRMWILKLVWLPRLDTEDLLIIGAVSSGGSCKEEREYLLELFKT